MHERLVDDHDDYLPRLHTPQHQYLLLFSSNVMERRTTCKMTWIQNSCKFFAFDLFRKWFSGIYSMYLCSVLLFSSRISGQFLTLAELHTSMHTQTAACNITTTFAFRDIDSIPMPSSFAYNVYNAIAYLFFVSIAICNIVVRMAIVFEGFAWKL